MFTLRCKRHECRLVYTQAARHSTGTRIPVQPVQCSGSRAASFSARSGLSPATWFLVCGHACAHQRMCMITGGSCAGAAGGRLNKRGRGHSQRLRAQRAHKRQRHKPTTSLWAVPLALPLPKIDSTKSRLHTMDPGTMKRTCQCIRIRHASVRHGRKSPHACVCVHFYASTCELQELVSYASL